jgi:hypothetical protein
MSADPGESARLIADATLSLDQTRALLLEPTARNVEIAAAALSRAIGRIEALQICMAERGPLSAQAQDSAVALREGIAGVALLLRHAAAYHSRLLQSMMEAERSASPPPPAIGMGRGVQLHA